MARKCGNRLGPRQGGLIGRVAHLHANASGAVSGQPSRPWRERDFYTSQPELDQPRELTAGTVLCHRLHLDREQARHVVDFHQVEHAEPVRFAD